jgi:lysophospholipase L1-like esterase
MDRSLSRLARVLGTAVGAFAGVVAVQLMRLRRMEFLPGHPGFYVNHVVVPSQGDDEAGRHRLRMVVLGDSTTAGVGVERAEDSLPYLIARRLAEAEQRAVHVVSYGWAGARAADLAGQLARAIQPLRATETQSFLAGADVVAIVIGSNDATHQTPPGSFRTSLRSTIDGVRRVAPSARVVLAGIPAFRGALRGIEPLIFLADQYARLLRPISRAEAARAGAAYADLARYVPSLIRGRTDVLSRDQFHPSVVGYSAWADVIGDALLSDPGESTAARLEPART